MSLSRVLLAFSVLAAATCAQRGPLSLPELEPHGGLPPGLAWQFQNGPDFYLYRASSASPSSLQVGLYFGTAPERLPQSNEPGTPGVLAGRPVVWTHFYAEGLHHADALLLYRHSPAHLSISVHAWLTAPTLEDLARLQAALATVTLRPRTSGPA